MRDCNVWQVCEGIAVVAGRVHFTWRSTKGCGCVPFVQFSCDPWQRFRFKSWCLWWLFSWQLFSQIFLRFAICRAILKLWTPLWRAGHYHVFLTFVFLLIIFYWISNNCDCVACVYVCGHGHACICVNSGFCFPGILSMFCYFCIWSYLLLVFANMCVYFSLPCRPGLLVLVCRQSVQSLGTVCAFVRSSTGLAVRVCTDASVRHS